MRDAYLAERRMSAVGQLGHQLGTESPDARLAVMPFLAFQGLGGGRWWDRTTDPYDVKVGERRRSAGCDDHKSADFCGSDGSWPLGRIATSDQNKPETSPGTPKVPGHSLGTRHGERHGG